VTPASAGNRGNAKGNSNQGSRSFTPPSKNNASNAREQRGSSGGAKESHTNTVRPQNQSHAAPRERASSPRENAPRQSSPQHTAPREPSHASNPAPRHENPPKEQHPRGKSR
jgi:hypothetical protein